MALSTPLHSLVAPAAVRSRARLRRALVEQDRRSARLAELTLIGDVLREACAVVERGWLQHDWFGEQSSEETEDERPACLVGAVILAAGGIETRHHQLVQRGLDVVWHAYAEDLTAPVQFCPPSNVRMARVRLLTAWNDEHRRRPEEVAALLGAAVATARRERALLLEPSGVRAPLR